MNNKLVNLFWGIVLIAAGIVALAQTLGYLAPQDPTTWAYIFAGISVVSLIFYIAGGWRNWGALFPVTIFGALALILVMAARGVANPTMAAPLFIGIGLPFLLALLVDPRGNWWAPIPLGVMAFLTLVLLAVEKVPGEWIGVGLFLFLAVGFFVVYLSRRVLWAALVAYIMLVLAFMPLLGMTSHPELAGVLFFVAIGLPFLFVYVRWPERWWAIIPAGILLTMGIVTAVFILPVIPAGTLDTRLANALIFAGTAGTFGVLWARHHLLWARVVTIVCAALALAGLLLPGKISYWPLALIAGGILVLYSALRPRPA